EGPFTNNNTRAAASTITDIPADLVVTNVQAPATSFSGEPIAISWTVKNQGANAVWSGPQRWNEYVFFSPDAQFDPSRATFLGTFVHVAGSPLQPGDSYTSNATVTLPEGINGKFFIHVFTDRNPVGGGLDPVGAGDFPSW